jgi:hypothetical protein
LLRVVEKNERSLEFMHYGYERADIKVDPIWKNKPPMIEKITFSITIQSEDDHINTDLLLRNLQNSIRFIILLMSFVTLKTVLSF